MKARSTAMTQTPRDGVPCGSMLALPDPRRPDRASPSTNIWLSLFSQQWYDQRRKRPALFKSGQWHFHQDNALVHNSILVTDYLTKMGINTVHHPPYRPDLASCDLWLFALLRGCRYETIEEMKEVVTKVIDTLTQEDFHGAFQKLLERYNKCIAAGGDYFEGD